MLFLALNFYALSLRFAPVPTTILMVQRGLSGESIQRDWTPLSEISPYIVRAVMAGEDSRFCEHEGLDWKAIEQAFEDNQESKGRRGGSTITQQTAKNIFFWNGGGYVRKAGEAWFASLIDFIWGKSRVMEIYLNIAEWGDGIFGAEAAAQNRFGKSAKEVTPQEAALLAAVLPSPNKWRVDPPSDFVKGRAKTLRQRMRVIHDSRYDSCVKGMARVKYIPPLKTDTSETKSSIPKNKQPDELKPNTTPTLDDILDKAEESLKKPAIDIQLDERSKEPPE